MHLRVLAADGLFVELNVAIRRALAPTESDGGAIGPSGTDEPNLLSHVAAFDYLEAAGQELQRAVSRPFKAE